MPAHKSAAHVGKLRLSNGELLTQMDVDANDKADKLAKQAVEEHRVSAIEVKNLKDAENDAWHKAKWIGRVTSLACNIEAFPFKDNEASRWKVDKAKCERRACKERGQP